MARKKKTVRRSKTSARKRPARARTATIAAKRRGRPATGASKKKKKTTSTRRRSSGSAASASPSSLSLAQLQAEIAARVADLHARRSELEAEIADIDAALAEVGGSAGAVAAPARRRGRPVGSKTRAKTAAADGPGRPKKTGRRGGRTKGAGGKSLAESLHAVLQGKEMKVAELVDAVQAAGYKSSSPNLRIMVSAALSRNKGSMFKNVSRGVYTAIG